MSEPNAFLAGGDADGEYVHLTPDPAARAVRGPGRSYYAPTGRQLRTARGLVEVWEFAGEWRPYSS